MYLYQEIISLLFCRKNQEASLLDLDSVNSSVNLFKQAPLLLETASDAQQPEFDQILDLTTTSNNSNSTTMNQEDSNSNGDGNGDSEQAPPPMATPLIAFEDSINASPKQEVPTAGEIFQLFLIRVAHRFQTGLHLAFIMALLLCFVKKMHFLCYVVYINHEFKRRNTYLTTKLGKDMYTQLLIKLKQLRLSKFQTNFSFIWCLYRMLFDLETIGVS